jgi:predicted metalloprotease with PDZ domain
MKIYWSGAILALRADIELRLRSDGRDSLDAILERLQRCCLPSSRSWTGVELLQELDNLVGEPVFMPLYRRYADATGFPAFDTMLSELGVVVDRGRITLDDNAELAEIRRAITATN